MFQNALIVQLYSLSKLRESSPRAPCVILFDLKPLIFERVQYTGGPGQTGPVTLPPTSEALPATALQAQLLKIKCALKFASERHYKREAKKNNNKTCWLELLISSQHCATSRTRGALGAQTWHFCSTVECLVTLLQVINTLTYSSLASHTLTERKGLVTLQPSSYCHARKLMWPFHFAWFYKFQWNYTFWKRSKSLVSIYH